MNAGIVLFALVVLVQLITLPVEFDATNRAKAVLSDVRHREHARRSARRVAESSARRR